MSKIKLLTYGNCQLCVVSNYLEKYFSNEFDIIACEDCGLRPFWDKSKTFCVWAQENQSNISQCVYEKIAEADVFLFQSHSGKFAIDPLKTEYLQNEVAKKNNTRCIAVQNYSEQDIYPEPEWLIEYAISKGFTDPKEIYKFLCNSDDPYFAKYMKESFEKSRIQNKKWEDKANNTYDDYISMNDFIIDNYYKKLVSLSWNHPSEHFFAEFISRILNKFNLKFDESTLCKIELPVASGNSLDFSFFRKAFPNIIDSSCRNRDLFQHIDLQSFVDKYNKVK